GDAVAPADRLGPFGDAVRAGGTGRHDADVVPDRTGLDGDHPRRRIDEGVGDERRWDAARALLVEVDPGLDHQLLATGPGPEARPDVLAVLGGDLEAGVGQGLLGGRHAEPHRAFAAPDRLG